MRRLAIASCLLALGCLSAPEYDGRPCGPNKGCPEDFLCHVDNTCRRTCDFAAPCPSPLVCVVGICVRGGGPDAGGVPDAGDTTMMGGPCEGPEGRCTMPPADECEGDVYRTYASVGVCDPSTRLCMYAEYESPCVDCASQCLDPCAALTCDDLAGGCRANGRCEPDTLGGVRCAYDLADEGATCMRLSGAGVCASGVCGDCVDAQDCSSADLCVADIQCNGGVCSGGTRTVCDEQPDQCHEAIGICEPSTGECSYAPILDGSTCDDSNACTEDEVCTTGVCGGGTALVCDDSNICTTDGCLPATGCDFRPNTNPCDDRDLCTYDDVCSGGMCAGTTVTCTNEECAMQKCNGTSTCNVMPLPDTEPCTIDGNPCTDDRCDGAGACEHRPLTDGASCGATDALRCCSGNCVDISSDRSHCGGCDTACTGTFACESISVTTQCSIATANTSGRCRCLADTSHCPRGQVCRNAAAPIDRCAPRDATECTPGSTFVDLAGCPNFCGY